MKLRFLEPSPTTLFLFRVSPEIYEHPVHHRGFDPRREDQSDQRWTRATGTTVRHISIPRREQQRLFPVRSYIMYPPLTGRAAQSYCRRPTNGLESTGNDTWFMVLLHTRATALERERERDFFLERSSCARLQVHRGCTCVHRKVRAGYPLFRWFWKFKIQRSPREITRKLLRVKKKMDEEGKFIEKFFLKELFIPHFASVQNSEINDFVLWIMIRLQLQLCYFSYPRSIIVIYLIAVARSWIIKLLELVAWRGRDKM